MCSRVNGEGGRAHQYVIFVNPGVDPSVTLALPPFDPLLFLAWGQSDNHLSNSMKPGSRLKVILNPKSNYETIIADIYYTYIYININVAYSEDRCRVEHQIICILF